MWQRESFGPTAVAASASAIAATAMAVAAGFRDATCLEPWYFHFFGLNEGSRRVSSPRVCFFFLIICVYASNYPHLSTTTHEKGPNNGIIRRSVSNIFQAKVFSFFYKFKLTFVYYWLHNDDRWLAAKGNDGLYNNNNTWSEGRCAKHAANTSSFFKKSPSPTNTVTLAWPPGHKLSIPSPHTATSTCRQVSTTPSWLRQTTVGGWRYCSAKRCRHGFETRLKVSSFVM